MLYVSSVARHCGMKVHFCFFRFQHLCYHNRSVGWCWYGMSEMQRVGFRNLNEKWKHGQDGIFRFRYSRRCAAWCIQTVSVDYSLLCFDSLSLWYRHRQSVFTCCCWLLERESWLSYILALWESRWSGFGGKQEEKPCTTGTGWQPRIFDFMFMFECAFHSSSTFWSIILQATTTTTSLLLPPLSLQHNSHDLTWVSSFLPIFFLLETKPADLAVQKLVQISHAYSSFVRSYIPHFHPKHTFNTTTI